MAGESLGSHFSFCRDLMGNSLLGVPHPTFTSALCAQTPWSLLPRVPHPTVTSARCALTSQSLVPCVPRLHGHSCPVCHTPQSLVLACLLGWRIGKGEGYADLEYAMMVSMGAVCEGTPVVTIVHDCQVLPQMGQQGHCQLLQG
jgi:hypothetical protein